MAKSTRTRGLDPVDWSQIRRDGHRMLEDMFDHLETLREQKLWRPPGREALASIRQELPRLPADLTAVHAQFHGQILPYASGGFLARRPPGRNGDTAGEPATQ